MIAIYNKNLYRNLNFHSRLQKSNQSKVKVEMIESKLPN